MASIGHVNYSKLWMISYTPGRWAGHGTASLTQEFIQISQVCIIIYILIYETLFLDLSDWKSPGLNQNSATCQRSRDLKVDDNRPSISQSMTKKQSASTEFKQTTLIDTRKISNIGAVFVLENYKLHDVCESQLPENRKYYEGNKEA